MPPCGIEVCNDTYRHEKMLKHVHSRDREHCITQYTLLLCVSLYRCAQTSVLNFPHMCGKMIFFRRRHKSEKDSFMMIVFKALPQHPGETSSETSIIHLEVLCVFFLRFIRSPIHKKTTCCVKDFLFLHIKKQFIHIIYVHIAVKIIYSRLCSQCLILPM